MSRITKASKLKAKQEWLRATGERFAAARKASGLTLAEVGLAIGIDKQTVYRWEAGGDPPDSYALARACAAMGVSVDQVLAPVPQQVAS